MYRLLEVAVHKNKTRTSLWVIEMENEIGEAERKHVEDMLLLFPLN